MSALYRYNGAEIAIGNGGSSVSEVFTTKEVINENTALKVYRYNLLNPDSLLSDKSISGGTEIDKSGYTATPFIMVDSEVYYTGNTAGSAFCYDEYKNYLGTATKAVYIGSQGIYSQTLLSGTKYIRFSYTSTAKMWLTDGKMGNYGKVDYGTVAVQYFDETILGTLYADLHNNLNGKVWLCIGDSITYSAGGYRELIASEHGLTTSQYTSGNGWQAGYEKGDTYCVENKAKNNAFSSYISAPDIITIALGTNDFGNSCPIGTITDNADAQSADSYTFYGCYKSIINSLFACYGHVPMVLFTPLPRGAKDVANSGGHTLKDYADAVKAIGEMYSIPVLDLYGGCGLPIGTLVDASASDVTYTSDTLHLTIDAHKRIAPKIYDAMNLAVRAYE